MQPTRPLPARAATPSPSRRRLFLLAVNVFVFSIFAPPLRTQERTASASPPDASQRREVLLTVTVTDGAGSYVTGLGREHFEVFDGKSRGEITSFGAAEEAASVVVLLDMSASTSDDSRVATWDVLRRAFVAFGRKSPRENEYALLTFNKKLVELTDWTRDPLVIAKSLAALDPKAVPGKEAGGTALYDSCAAALERFARASQRKRVLLILTDGMPDNASRRTRLGGLKKLIRESGALVYAVAFIPPSRPGEFSSLHPDGPDDLQDLTAVSGGRAYFPQSSAEANNVAERIAVELRHQYIVGFAAAGAAKPGELNKVRVKITPPPTLRQKIYSRSPDGYYSAPN